MTGLVFVCRNGHAYDKLAAVLGLCNVCGGKLVFNEEADMGMDENDPSDRPGRQFG